MSYSVSCLGLHSGKALIADYVENIFIRTNENSPDWITAVDNII